jgi:branched-chain amino acid transport system permease protein
MWVIAELVHLLVNLDRLIQGETGTSLISLNTYEASTAATIYWLALASMTALLGILFVVLRSRAGAAIQAIRDNEDAAASVGVRVVATKRLLFVLAASRHRHGRRAVARHAVTFQPKTYFSVQWTAYMIFMVLVGGIGRFEGAILGAIIFFLIDVVRQRRRLVSCRLGATALVFSLLLPRGLWGAIEARWDLRLLPVGYRLVLSHRRGRSHRQRNIQPSNREGRKRMTMLLGKTILITGVASGIGARTAELPASSAPTSSASICASRRVVRHLRQG